MASGAAPHTPSGSISFGTVPLPSLPQPQPCTDALDILATPAPPITSMPLTCTPRVMPRQVLDVIARAPPTQVATPVAMHINNHMTTITPYVGGPVAEAIARMAFERARHEEEKRLSGQAERDMCAATARVLQRAGRTEQAAAVMLAAPPHVPAPAHTGQTLSLAPSNVISCAPPALASPSEPLAVSWQGSLVAASLRRPPPPGTTLTPVQVAVEGVSYLPPGERRAKVASLAAAARIVAYMTLTQVNTLLGRPAVLVTEGDAVAHVTASAIRTIGFGWSAGTIDGARRTWLRLTEYAHRTNAMAGLVEYYFHGYIIARYLAAVDSEARATYLLRNPGKPRHIGDAKGATARDGQAASCLFLARNLTFPIQVDCKAVTLVTKASRRRTTRQAPALGPRLIFVLCWLTEHGDSHHVRCHAAGWLAMVHFALRLVNAQRSCIISVAGDVVRGSCDLDAKISAGEQNGRPMWAYRYDMRGRDLWINLIISMRDDPPRAPPAYGNSTTAEDPHYFLRDTNSPNGSPCEGKATAWVDLPLTGQRAYCSLRSLAQLSPWAIPKEVAMELTGHSPKHDLVCVSRAGGDPASDTNEIGKWSGSLAQSADLLSTTATSALHARYNPNMDSHDHTAMPELYSSETVEEIVPGIMRRQIQRLQSLVTAPGVESLPAKGGWRHIPRHNTHVQCPTDPTPASLATALTLLPPPPPGPHAQRTTSLALLPPPTPPPDAHTPAPASKIRTPTAHPSVMRNRHARRSVTPASAPLPATATQQGTQPPQREQHSTPPACLPSGNTRSRQP